MKTNFNQGRCFWLSLAGLLVLGSSLPAQAQTINSKELGLRQALVSAQQEQLQQTASTAAPVPGTTLTKAAPLSSQLSNSASEPTTAPLLAQDIDVDPGQATRGGSSYVGIAGNLGLDGETALGDESIAIISKIGFTNSISARPSVFINNDPVILLPVTYDFSFQPTDAFDETFALAPYAGGGIAISTGDNSEVGVLLTGGVDFPINSQFTATAAVNAAFLDETEIGLLIGVGYNFTGF